VTRLALKDVSVRFGGLLALDAVDLEIVPGHVSGLIGPNGAGKTTLFNVVTGLQSPSRGRVLLDERDVTDMPPHKRARLGLARTFQRLELFGTLTARENVQMAAETQRRRLPQGSTPASVASAVLERVGLTSVAEEPADVLPTGLARLLELARSMATVPSVILLDEPSAGLDREETIELGEVLKSLAAEHVAVLLVEHDMSLVMSVCDQVTVLDFGVVIARGEPEAVRNNDAVQLAYLGTADTSHETKSSVAAESRSKNGDDLYHRSALARAITPGWAGVGTGSSNPQPAPGRPAEVSANGARRSPSADALQLIDVRASYGRIEVVHGVSLSVPEGTVLALLGPNGAGKSTLLKVASGQIPATGGTVRFRGEAVARTSPDVLARRGLCAMLEGRGVFPNLTVAENLLMYTYRTKDVQISDLEERSYEKFPVLGTRRKQLAGSLSGGEQQMLALSRVLYTKPQVLLLDELSMGLAPRVVSELYELVAEAVRADHLTVLLVEQFAQTALALADSAAVMVNGRVVRSGAPDEVADELMRAYMGDAG